MPREITRDEVSSLVSDGAALVEVLPREEYEEQHLPGAISIPLRCLDAQTHRKLNAAAGVIVYCWDYT